MFSCTHIKIYIFFQKWLNIYERSGIGWIERKITFQIFPIYIFWVMVIFYYLCEVVILIFDEYFTITWKIKIGKIWNMVFFFLFSRFRIFHLNFINFEKKKILMLHDNTVAWLFWYAVHTNLFLLESTNPKKNSQTLDAFWCGRRE